MACATRLPNPLEAGMATKSVHWTTHGRNLAHVCGSFSRWFTCSSKTLNPKHEPQTSQSTFFFLPQLTVIGRSIHVYLIENEAVSVNPYSINAIESADLRSLTRKNTQCIGLINCKGDVCLVSKPKSNSRRFFDGSIIGRNCGLRGLRGQI